MAIADLDAAQDKGVCVKTFATMTLVGVSFCIGLGVGIAVVQLRLGAAWHVVSGVETHLLHTDFTPNWPMLHKQALFKDNPSSKPIVMAGDSLIDYADWSDLLHRTDVGNRGITGELSSDLLQRVDMIAKPKATVAFMIGENDLAEHRTVAEVCDTIALIVKRLQLSHPVVLQATLLTAAPALNGKIKELDTCERRLCESDATCAFLDLNPQLAPDGTLTPALTFDGFHLNQRGYEIWAAALDPVLDKVAR